MRNHKLKCFDEERGVLIPTIEDYEKFSEKYHLINQQYERYGPRRGLAALNQHMSLNQVNHIGEEFYKLRDKMKAELESKNQEEMSNSLR